MSRISSQVTARSPRSALVGHRGWVILRVVAARMVFAPVLATTAVAEPAATVVPVRHRTGASSTLAGLAVLAGAGRSSQPGSPAPGSVANLATGIGSPVKVAWSRASPSAATMRQSAGTTSPAPSSTRSPGASSRGFRVLATGRSRAPRPGGRRTVTRGAARLRRPASRWPKRRAWCSRSPRLAATIAVIRATPTGLPVSATTASRMASSSTKGLRTLASNAGDRPGGSWLMPCSLRRPITSVSDRPVSPEPRRRSASAGGQAARASRSAAVVAPLASSSVSSGRPARPRVKVRRGRSVVFIPRPPCCR